MPRRLYRAGKENRTQNKVEQPNGDYNEIGNRIRKGRKRSDKSTDRDKEFQTNFLLDRINIGIMEELVNNGDILKVEDSTFHNSKATQQSGEVIGSKKKLYS